MKTHLAVSEKRGDGNWTGTLCGSQSQESKDGTNAEASVDKVDCRNCKKIIADPTHWRHRRYLGRKTR